MILQAAETGLIGELALVLVGASLAWVAWKSSCSKDRLFAAIGTGVFCMYVFYFIEEQLAYSLREEAPLGVLWLLTGVAVVCLRMDASCRPVREPVTEELAVTMNRAEVAAGPLGAASPGGST